MLVWYLAGVGALYVLVAVILMLHASARARIAVALTIVACALAVGLWLVPWFWKLLLASLITGATADLLTARHARRSRLPEPATRAPRSLTASM
jgi:hypothetical protein